MHFNTGDSRSKVSQNKKCKSRYERYVAAYKKAMTGKNEERIIDK